MILTIIFAVVLNPLFITAKNEPCSKPILYKNWTKAENRNTYKSGIATFNPNSKTAFQNDPFSHYCKILNQEGVEITTLRLLTTANKDLSKGNCNQIVKRKFKGVDANKNIYIIKIIEPSH